MNFIIYFILSIISKILASVREFGVGLTWGTGSVVDSFIISMMLPMLFLDMVNVLFNSTYVGIYIRSGKEKQKLFLKDVFLFTVLFIVFTSLLISIFIELYITHFEIPIATKQIIKNIKIYIIIYYGMMVMCELFKAHMVACEKQKFMPLPMIVANVAFIFSLFIFSDDSGDRSLIYCFMSSAIIQVIIYSCLLRKRDIYPVENADVNINEADRKTNLKAFLRNTPAVLFNAGVNQSSKITDKLIASGFIIGSLSSLYFAQQLYALYVNIIIVSVLTFAYPRMCSKVNNDAAFSKYITDVILSLVSLLILPVLLGWVFSRNIFQFILENNSPENIIVAQKLFVVLSIAVFFEAISATLKRAYWALNRIKITVYISAFNVGCNIILSIIFSVKFNLIGLAYAYLFSSVISCVALFIIYQKDFIITFDKRAGYYFIAMLAFAIATSSVLGTFDINNHSKTSFIYPGIITLIGLVGYCMLIYKTKMIKVLL